MNLTMIKSTKIMEMDEYSDDSEPVICPKRACLLVRDLQSFGDIGDLSNETNSLSETTNWELALFTALADQSKTKEMFQLLLKPEVKQKIVDKDEQLKEEEWNECEARTLRLEEKCEILKKQKEQILPPYMKGNLSDSNVEVTPLIKRIEEQCELFIKRLKKARGLLSGDDSDPSTEIEVTDVLAITDIDNISDFVDFMTGDDCLRMEYFLTKRHVLDDCKETLVGLYENDSEHHAFVVKYNLGILTPVRAFFLKLLLKRRVWTHQILVDHTDAEIPEPTNDDNSDDDDSDDDDDDDSDSDYHGGRRKQATVKMMDLGVRMQKQRKMTMMMGRKMEMQKTKRK